ncbi:conserved hypothetical protein [Solidesulfovibrio fructosivorans JJ]]|uniref:Metal dependent phosphohydrolase n=1 Tax=Solidesulfovibrio fructosivorans JJ] TaxID=596151 RepID=E1K1T9_SOLFR|nr:twin-arginine translocation signal domain-containing protein [Solidesulfovibrio fructosivorans]EFL49439.1 conserved hypothetical protein [Solidesulfovibrio fructosivorans JJ]]
MKSGLDRRKFLELGAAACGMLAVAGAFPQKAGAQAPAQPVALDACLAMSPLAMAESSAIVDRDWKYLGEVAASIKDPAVRQKVRAILDNPAPTLADRLADPKTRTSVHQELEAKGFLKGQTVAGMLPPVADPSKAAQPFKSAPGSGYTSHHAFPGGLVVHTAGNMRNTLGIHDGYVKNYGLTLDRDTTVVSQMLHDLHKPWVFVWAEDGASRKEQSLAGTGEHHVLSVAESIVRGLPPQMVVAQACAHNHPGDAKDEADVVGWITAAAILAGVDPVKAGLLGPDGKTLPVPRRMEGFVCHLGDHDWVLTVPAGKWTTAALGQLAKERYGIADADSKAFNQFRNYVFAHGTMMGLYAAYSASGKDALADAVAAIVKPV